jgi:hypothetical protein
MISTDALEFALQNALPQTAFGLFFMSLVLIAAGYGFVGTMQFFKARVGQGVHPSKLKATFLFVLCIQMLALTQLTSMCIWALALWATGIAADWYTAIRLSASCYTTLGNFTPNLPGGWYLIPAFIAFSGLFSFAWASSSTIAMVGALNKYLDSSKHSISPTTSN